MDTSAYLVASLLISGVFGCSDPGTPDNGVRDPPESGFSGPLPADTILHFSCSEGYLLDGPPKIICTREGQWLPSDYPSCIAVDPCSHTPCQNGATCVISRSSSTGYYCHCSPIYYGDQCENRKDCPLPPDDEVPNSHYTVDGSESDSQGWYQPDTVLTYQCEAGYYSTTHGSNQRTCQHGGWVGDTPNCVKEIECEDPGMPDNAHRCCQNVFKAGVKVNFYCEAGYQMEGDEERTCQEDGTWTGAQPVCNQATPAPTPGGGNVLNTETLTIITATTGSILGILVVTVILTGRQCRSRQHRHHTSRNFPPSLLRARLARLNRDSDVAALFAVTDNINVVLPSYDEAVATVETTPTPESSRNNNEEQGRADDGDASTVVQGRPLPPLPPPNPTPSSRSRPRNRRSSANSQQEPLLPPPYEEDDVEPLDISEPGTGAQEGRGQDEGPQGAMGGDMIDIYAEVLPRTLDGQAEGVQNNNNNNTIEAALLNEES